MAYILQMRPPNRIRELRRLAGVSQTELGAAVGLTQGQIGHLENGQRSLSLEWMRRIARVLQVDVAALLVDEDNLDRLSDDERDVISLYRRAEPQARWYVKKSLSAILADRRPAAQRDADAA